jgi:outer membrane lipoprotein carrier protein
MASAVDQFKSFVSNTKSAKGEFVQQQIKMVDGNPKVSKTFSGAFVFARPGKFIWTYQKPYEQVLQADGEKLFIFDKDLNQVTIKN